MSMTLRFGGAVIGEALDFWTVTRRANRPVEQTGVLRLEALLSDNSPNVVYELHVMLKKIATTRTELQQWALTLGDRIKQGKQTVRVSGDGEELEMEEAVLMDPVSGRPSSAPHKILGIELVFLSSRRPT